MYILSGLQPRKGELDVPPEAEKRILMPDPDSESCAAGIIVLIVKFAKPIPT